MEMKDPESEFIKRTLEIIKQYNELVMPKVPEEKKYEETLFINCLLGLLVLPKEKRTDDIKELLEDITEWGLPADTIKSWGQCRTCKKDSDQNLKEFLRRMRNAVSHIGFTPISTDGKISGWEFEDENGFKASLEKDDLRNFLEKLARSLLED